MKSAMQRYDKAQRGQRKAFDIEYGKSPENKTVSASSGMAEPSLGGQSPCTHEFLKL